MFLLVGGSGFIGTNFSRFLLENNYNFKIYDIHKSKYLSKNIETIMGDVRDKTRLSQAMKGCDIVFHLVTAPSSLSLPSKEIYDIDVNGTKNVLNCAKKIGVEKVIFTSSASHVYGLVEAGSCPLREDSKLHPINEYGRNKVMAEELCKKASKNSELIIIVLRLSMVLGSYNFDPILIENMKLLFGNKRVVIAGDGESKNQSVHVEDVSNALLSCVDVSFPKYEVLNISGNEVLTINEFIKLSKQEIGSSSNVVHLPLSLAKSMVHIAWRLNRTNIHPSYLSLITQDQYFDINKAKHVLEWQPKYSTEDAIKDTVDFLRNCDNQTAF